jgi:hypothetical protein
MSVSVPRLASIAIGRFAKKIAFGDGCSIRGFAPKSKSRVHVTGMKGPRAPGAGGPCMSVV